MNSGDIVLTQRELEIVYLWEYTNSQIAQTLGLSNKTVKNHSTSIYRKIDAATIQPLPTEPRVRRTKALVVLVQRGIVALDQIKEGDKRCQITYW